MTPLKELKQRVLDLDEKYSTTTYDGKKWQAVDEKHINPAVA
jgi:hypothetical protein